MHRTRLLRALPPRRHTAYRERERERSVSETGRACVVCAKAEGEMGGLSEGKRSEAGRRGRAFGESLL